MTETYLIGMLGFIDDTISIQNCGPLSIEKCSFQLIYAMHQIYKEYQASTWHFLTEFYMMPV